MARRKRCLLYSQHLSGSGHFVRTYEIARALASRHEVYLVDGGRPIPRSPSRHPVTRISLPRIYRAADGIRVLDDTRPLAEVMRERKRILLQAIERLRPDVLLVEHFPFSKLHLRAEIVPLIGRARAVNTAARVYSSVRDITPRTVNEPEPARYRRDVLHLLESHFDAILVHADPGFVRLEEGIPWTGDIPLPIVYTGYVSERPADGTQGSARRRGPDGGLIIATAGGSGNADLVTLYIRAWQAMERQQALAGYRLLVFAPLFLPEQRLAQLAGLAIGSRIEIRPFSRDFVDWMYGAELAISEAGYNTCMNILETGTRAILIPNPLMSDQSLRARRFAESRLATVIEAGDLTPERLGRAMVDCLARPARTNNIDLDGARKTLAFLDSH